MNTTNLKILLCQVLKSCQIHFKVIINPGKRISLYIMFLITILDLKCNLL